MIDQEAPISYHLAELRKRLTISVLALVAGTIVSFFFYRTILDILLEGARNSLPVNGEIIYTEVTEFIGITMKVSLLGGIVLAFPMILYQVVMFVAPGLKPRERKYLFTLLPFSLLAFIGGGAFGFKVLIPPAIRFLVNWGSDIATPLIRVGNIVNLMVTLLFWMGLIFQLPIIAFFLTKIGIVTPQKLARGRRYALVGAVIMGAVITPTFDPINQMLVAGPILVLYEIGIWLSRIAKMGQKSQTSQAIESSK